jgi:hypothetical protein
VNFCRSGVSSPSSCPLERKGPQLARDPFPFVWESVCLLPRELQAEKQLREDGGASVVTKVELHCSASDDLAANRKVVGCSLRTVNALLADKTLTPDDRVALTKEVVGAGAYHVLRFVYQFPDGSAELWEKIPALLAAFAALKTVDADALAALKEAPGNDAWKGPCGGSLRLLTVQAQRQKLKELLLRQVVLVLQALSPSPLRVALVSDCQKS